MSRAEAVTSSISDLINNRNNIVYDMTNIQTLFIYMITNFSK